MHQVIARFPWIHECCLSHQRVNAPLEERQPNQHQFRVGGKGCVQSKQGLAVPGILQGRQDDGRRCGDRQPGRREADQRVFYEEHRARRCEADDEVHGYECEDGCEPPANHREVHSLRLCGYRPCEVWCEESPPLGILR